MVGREGKVLFPKCGNGQELKLTPRRYVATNHTLYTLALVAYGVGHSCTVLDDIDFLSGGPAWVTTERFDVQATIPRSPLVHGNNSGNGGAPSCNHAPEFARGAPALWCAGARRK